MVSARGEDLVTAPKFGKQLSETLELGARSVAVDLTETTFFDSSAIHASWTAGGRLQASGLQVCVVCGNPNIKKVFAIR